ncbi:hypothetical protein [Actinopolymorpha alba]|uniref:spermine/spermidine synthase domain-containing protein n=1 Tax=Actinopolymorpha alba TaxID=533267 RepID=UPI00036C4138|nr:hypothetical protein [Actinopolymorpha alba]
MAFSDFDPGVTSGPGTIIEPFEDGRPVVVAREETPRGSVALRRRRDPLHGEVYELIVNGAFVMDTLETSTERLLAESALAYARVAPRTVVVGGLGLGFTVRELLADERIEHLHVVELEPAVIEWVRAGVVPATAGVLDDVRVQTHLADVRHWLPARPAASADVIMLDVDNGPDFLVHLANSEVYETPFLAAVKETLRLGGVLAVWSAARATALAERLERTFGTCREVHRTIPRESRELDYFLYVATSTGSMPS